ncbi:zinc finger protein 385B-like isoform X3 [Syngnathus acus]|uniref:zinc finger protein 385B-like isoform X3 n=1 Tax=Syngnathus acus TaxID=161584 RepID=UPI001885BA23|nr:zinc finger protein 385B-like isoform X3 [Syngnathus acus]
MRSYNGRVSFKIPRRMSSATELPCNVQYGEHHSDHYSALPGAAASGYNSSDVNLQRFAKEFGFQRGPWKPNRPEGVCCCPAHEGHMCTTLAAALPGLLGGAGGPGGITMKPYPQFAVNSDGAALPAAIPAAPVYPHFSTMDPVHKAVIKHAFGVRRGAAKARRKRPVDCGVCRLTFNSDSQAEAHYRGGRHAKKLKMQRCTEDAKDGSSCDTGPARSTAADSNAVLNSLSRCARPSQARRSGPRSGSTVCSAKWPSTRSRSWRPTIWAPSTRARWTLAARRTRRFPPPRPQTRPSAARPATSTPTLRLNSSSTCLAGGTKTAWRGSRASPDSTKVNARR